MESNKARQMLAISLRIQEKEVTLIVQTTPAWPTGEEATDICAATTARELITAADGDELTVAHCLQAG